MHDKYICFNCGCIFEDYATYKSEEGEDCWCCPNCGGDFKELTEDMEGAYEIGYQKGMSTGHGIFEQRVKFALMHMRKCESVDKAIKVLEEWIDYDNNVATLARKYTN